MMASRCNEMSHLSHNWMGQFAVKKLEECSLLQIRFIFRQLAIFGSGLLSLHKEQTTHKNMENRNSKMWLALLLMFSDVCFQILRNENIKFF